MGKMYDADGEVLEFVGRQETRVRGVLGTDEMGRYWISDNEASGSEDLVSILPDEVADAVYEGEESEEYVFTVAVDVRKPTGEFRDADD